ncbi:Rad52/Rad22 family DNA repair protein [Brevibacillus sp. 179-C9.3 HS]|uniref:Rad52/Rad22 family DNA repair protein n=1 Tax=unclassified Brevibacillus TaxID=2684853 RepID=UPI0039A2A782
MTVNNHHSTLSDKLNLPFSYDEYGVNYEGKVYISAQSVVERLNEVIGMLNWEMELLSIDVNQDYKSVSILGELRIYDQDRDRWVSRRQFGNDTMTIKRDESDPTGQAFEDAKKSAMTDALKKCASWFGVASDVYSSRLSAISKKHSTYQTVLKHFNLQPESHENGIVVLPDTYRDYYQSMSWFGIFQSDIAALFKNDKQKHGNGVTGQNLPASPTGGNSAANTNSPSPFRLLVQSIGEQQQDGTVKFEAMMEDQSFVQVIVPKDKAEFSLTLQPGFVINVKGWFNSQTGFLRLGKAKIEIENKNGRRSA